MNVEISFIILFAVICGIIYLTTIGQSTGFKVTVTAVAAFVTGLLYVLCKRGIANKQKIHIDG